LAEPALVQRLLSVEEYRELGDSSPNKHEYVAGRVFAMVGVSRRHNRIMLSIGRKLTDGALSRHAVASHLRAAEDVDVQVRHRLPSLLSGIDHHAVAGVRHPFLPGDLRDLQQQVAG
jgi:hypothetical protein